MVLPDDPEVLDLPANPDVPLLVNTWQKVVQPAALSLTAFSVAVTGVAAVIARRNHMQELKQLHAQQAAAEEKESQE